ncbi:MAG TPA: helix-turn-helix transcriptional regulator [Thermoanaerobaculia bacterium]|jgi:transcriptional regulator with XRE-family HTH domain
MMERPQLTENIGANLRAARLQSATSLAGVAADAGISIATLSRIENGKQALDTSLLVVLAAIIGISPASILDVPDTPRPSNAEMLVAALRALPVKERRRVVRAVERDASPPGAASAAALIEEIAEDVAAVTNKLQAAHRQIRKERRRP